ncbi:hypothetical protein [Leifsonia sp. NPDC080035]|uniref:AbiEi antitoxin C-terminal domain-containing protein n=1 Tax=Leifsonia sp. NPDC080035 TaxID=3143936 RepID=A0AAU7GAX3_9MICO
MTKANPATPALLDRSVMPIAELFALVLDGQAFRVGDAFAPLDVADSPGLRARAFAELGAGPAIADRGTAAWIHGVRAEPPPQAQVCIDPKRRGRLPDGVDAHQHDVALGDAVSLAGVRVTSPLRTAADLLLTLPRFGRRDAQEAAHLLAIAGASVTALTERLASSRRNGVKRALGRVAQVERAVLP